MIQISAIEVLGLKFVQPTLLFIILENVDTYLKSNKILILNYT
jgi:hypothetical protein